MTQALTVPRLGIALAIAGVVALATAATGYANTGLPDGKENTVVIVQNGGNANADIVMDVYTRAGEAVPSGTRQIPGVAPGGIAQFPQALNTGLNEGFRGVGVLSSNQPINALLVRDILADRSTAAKSYSLANATNQGGHVLAAPLMFHRLTAGRWWNSRASIVNVGTSTACVRATYTLMPNIGATGNNAETIVQNGPGCNGGSGFPVAPGAQLTLSPESGDTNFPGNMVNTQFSALFEVTNPSSSNRIAAVVDLYRSDGNRLLGGYNGLVYDADDPSNGDVGTAVIAPIAMKSNSGFYTVIGVSNMDTSAAANVQIEYIGRLNDGTGAPFTYTENLGSVPEGAFHSTYETNNIPLGFIGYARITSNRAVGVTVIRGKLMSPTNRVVEPGYAAVNGVPEARATTSWSAPLYFRRFPSRMYNSWVQIQVPGGGNANVTLRYVGDQTAGCPVGPYTLNTSVSGSKIFYANLDNSPDNGFPAGNAPSCFLGGLEITSNIPVIVISQVGAANFPGGDSEGVTNAFPLN